MRHIIPFIASRQRRSILGKALLLSNLDDDLPFCTSLFNVSHRLFGRFKWEDPVQDRAYSARLDERTDLSQLIPVCPHEEKRIVDLMTLGLSSDPEAQETHHQFKYQARSKA